MGAYILIASLCCWIVVAFAAGGYLVNDAVDAFGDADPVYGNLPLHLLWLTAACVVSLPRIIFNAVMHHLTITIRRNS